MEIYKQGDGKLTRRVAFYSILVLSLWGFKELGKWLGQFGWSNTLVVDLEVPYYELPLTVGVILAMVLNVVFGIVLFRLLNRPKPATLLIDTEIELKKVSWPSWEDARQSTIIVLVFVAATAAFLTGIEVILKRVFDVVLSF